MAVHEDPPVDDNVRAREEGRQGAILVVGAVLLLVGAQVLKARAGVPAKAADYYALSVIVVCLLVLLSAPGAIRVIGDIICWFGGTLSGSKRWEHKAKTSWHEWLDNRAFFGWITRFARSDLGTLWLPFVVQLVGLAWLVHFSGGLSTSPFAGVPTVIFTLAVIITHLPTQEPRTARDGRRSRHPFWWLLLVAIIFIACLLAWDDLAPYELPRDIDPGATLAMTIVTLFVGLVLAIVARLGAVTDQTEAADPIEAESASPMVAESADPTDTN